MKGVDIEGKLHWTSRERWLILLGGLGMLAISILAVWWFRNTIHLRLLQFLWFIPNSIVGLSGIVYVVVAIVPRQTLWLADMLSVFWG